MIPPRRSIPLDYEVEPARDAGGDWPEFAPVDDDAGRVSVLGTAVVVIVALIAVALIFLIILGWRVAP